MITIHNYGLMTHLCVHPTSPHLVHPCVLFPTPCLISVPEPHRTSHPSTWSTSVLHSFPGCFGLLRCFGWLGLRLLQLTLDVAWQMSTAGVFAPDLHAAVRQKGSKGPPGDGEAFGFRSPGDFADFFWGVDDDFMIS